MVGKSTCGSGATGSWKKAMHAGERDAERQQRRGDRAGDEGARDVHCRSLSGRVARTGPAGLGPAGCRPVRGRRAATQRSKHR